MSLYKLKPCCQCCLRPIVALLARLQVHANHITLLALVISLLGGATLAYFLPESPRVLLLLPLLAFTRIALNIIDGMLARDYNMQSRLGAILSEQGDLIADVALYIPFIRIPHMPSALIVSAVILSLLTEFASLQAEALNGQKAIGGPLGKPERAVFFSLFAIVLVYYPLPQPALVAVCIALNTLLLVTILNRTKKALI